MRTTALFWMAIAATAGGTVKTTWKYSVGSRSARRRSSHSARASDWQVGQWRLRHELYQTRRWPQWSHCSTWPPSAAVRHCSMAVITRLWAVDRTVPTWARKASP